MTRRHRRHRRGLVGAPLVHVHSSSRYSRTPESLSRAIKNYIERDLAEIITFTEVADNPREKPLRSVEGWKSVTGDISRRNDGGIMWDEAKWTLIESWNHEIATLSYYSKNGYHFPPVAATSVILQNVVTGKKLLVSVAHMPPTVEGPFGFSGPKNRVASWLSALDGWRAFWREHKAEVDGIMIVADWNLNLRLPWVRAYFKANMPKFDIAWGDQPLPSSRVGTTGRGGIIDFSMIRGDLERFDGPFILPDDDSSDHRPYREILSL